jgi:tRNA1(Val) A37 N6-methylase TrmN6
MTESASTSLDSIQEQMPHLASCWKCHGYGKKYEKATKSFSGDSCNVCTGQGTRSASQKSLELAQQPGYIQSLRGYPEDHPLRQHFPDKFASPRAFQSTDNIPSHLLPQAGEVLASLGCSDWRVYQLQNGNKLTVDDFVCAYVASQEMLKRGWATVNDIRTSHGDILLGGKSVQGGVDVVVKHDKGKEAVAPCCFTHADIGTGCGTVIMMVAWAFMGQILSIGVEAQDISFSCLRRGLEWNVGSDGTHADDVIRIQQADLRTWDGDTIVKPPYQLITGTPPYFPAKSFVGSQNHEQKIRCRIPTRGGAADYIRTAARLLEETEGDDRKSQGGLFCMVEAAFEKARNAVLQTAQVCGMKIERRLDVITREGLPPRFSCWVMTKPKTIPGRILGENGTDNVKSFLIETLTLRKADFSRTKEYSAALECMGWIDFETHSGKPAKGFN